MNNSTKVIFSATVISFAVAAGAAPSQAGILDRIFGGGGVKITGNINQTVNASGIRTSGNARVNAAIIKGNFRARNVTQNVTLRNISIGGNQEQNYAVIEGR